MKDKFVEQQKSFYVTDWLERRSTLSPERIALYDVINQREISYRAWNRAVNRTANYLHMLGVKKGDRVAVYATNCVEYLDVLMACNKTGAILQNVNWRLTVPELEGILSDAEPVVLIYTDDFVTQINELRPRMASIRHYVAVNDPAVPSDRHFSERDNYPDEFSDFPELGFDDPWVICYTGGTTGLPKGAILTHGNMTWNSVNAVMSVGLDQHDVYLLSMPLFHTGGLNIYTLPLFHTGGKVIVTKRFEVDEAFDLIEQHQVTVYLAVPTMYIMMQQHPRWDTVDFSSIKAIFSGGAPCPQPVYEKFWEKGVDVFRISYGLTEAGPYNIWMPDGDIKRKPGSIGVPVFHADVKIVRPDGTVCDADEPGELLVRGPHVTPGYWNNPEATAKTIVDGWLYTGDLARRDREGYYYIIGRSKDMIISGGENIYPAEIESVMHQHPAVAEAALIGVPDAKWGEIGQAIVVLKAGQHVTAEELLAFLADRLARYKLPRSVIFVDAIPKTAIGKIDKKLLVEMYR